MLLWAITQDSGLVSCLWWKPLADFRLEVFPEVIALELAQGDWTYTRMYYYVYLLIGINQHLSGYRSSTT